MPTMDLHIKPLKPRKTHNRSWANRPKVSACLSSNFPWEVVLSFVQSHHRSVIILQMVSRSLYNSIKTHHIFWCSWYANQVTARNFLRLKVVDPRYPSLNLFKAGLSGLPLHMGPFSQDEAFTSYVRRLFALMHGTRCGMCGCRHRHDVYWSLRMRVCRLCMTQNTISSQTLFRKYGVDYNDISAEISGKVFYFKTSVAVSNDSVAFHEAEPNEMRNKTTLYMYWLPHLQQILDLPTLRAQQLKRREAASRLTAIVRRVYIITQRIRFCDRRSIDCVVLSLYKNEKRRVTSPYWRYHANDSAEWAFPAVPFCKMTKHFFRNKESNGSLHKRLADWEDFPVI